MFIIDWDKIPNLLKLKLSLSTYNRQKYLMRQMKYWLDSLVKIHVLAETNIPIKIKDITGLRKKNYYMRCIK